MEPQTSTIAWLKTLGDRPKTYCPQCSKQEVYCLNWAKHCWEKLPVCSGCLAIEWQENEAKRREAIVKKMRAKLQTATGQRNFGIPYQYHEASFKDFAPGSGATAANVAAEWTKAEQPGMLTFSGPAGTGKTRLAWAVVRALIYDGRRPIFKSGPELCQELRKAARATKRPAIDIPRFIETQEALILDDFGAEKLTAFIFQEYYRILAEREMWGRPTLITTNLTIRQIGELTDENGVQQGTRIASRLAGGTVLKFTGPDRRIGAKP